jgi:hypothetical protein
MKGSRYLSRVGVQREGSTRCGVAFRQPPTRLDSIILMQLSSVQYYDGVGHFASHPHPGDSCEFTADILPFWARMLHPQSYQRF